LTTGDTIDIKSFPQKTTYYKGIKFASKSEVICAKFLEAFVPGWELDVGKTYAVHIGHGKYCDFRIKDTLFEYHPIVLPLELSKGAYKMLTHALKGLPIKNKDKIKAAFKKHCKEEYWRKRHFSIRVNHDKDIQECSLILADSAESFYDEILVKFGKNIPKKEEVIKTFPRY